MGQISCSSGNEFQTIGPAVKHKAVVLDCCWVESENQNHRRLPAPPVVWLWGLQQ